MYKFIAIFFALSQVLCANEPLLFKPLIANPYEPRIGAMYQFNDKKLRLDIGVSYDILKIAEDTNRTITLGADFFTFTRLRSEANFKFPVETSDYFFGINFNIKDTIFSYPFYSRLRLSHISSHLVDGWSENGIFKDLPIVYSREFIDLAIAFDLSFYRIYGGINFVFSTIPSDAEKFILQFGIDRELEISDNIIIQTGLDNKVFQNRSQSAYQIGIAFKTSNKIKISTSLYYFNGATIHGAFYKKYDNYYAIGFQLSYY